MRQKFLSFDKTQLYELRVIMLYYSNFKEVKYDPLYSSK